MAQKAPADWERTVQRRLCEGEASALGETYDRFASLVHGLALRVLMEEAAADRITGKVFARLWQHPEDYEPARSPLRCWLADLTHRLAVQELYATRATTPAQGDGAPDGTTDLEHMVHKASVVARADYLLTSMPAHLRAPLDLAYFKRRDCRQIAEELGITEAETHDRLRLGLRLMATAYDKDSPNPPLACGALPSASAPPPSPGRPT